MEPWCVFGHITRTTAQRGHYSLRGVRQVLYEGSLTGYRTRTFADFARGYIKIFQCREVIEPEEERERE